MVRDVGIDMIELLVVVASTKGYVILRRQCCAGATH